MRDKKLIKRRLLSLFLSVLMLIGILPLNLVKVQASGGVKIDETNFPDPIVLKSVQGTFQGMNEIDSKSLNNCDILFIRNDVYFNGKFLGTFEGAKDLTGLNLFPNLSAISLAKPNMKSLESLSGCRKLDEIDIEGGSIDNFDLKYCNMTRVVIKDCKINSFKLYDIETGIFGRISALSYLILNNCGLSKIEGFGNFTVLSSLSIDNNKFTAFDLSSTIIADDFSCKNNQMETLNFGGSNKDLNIVDCSVNRLRNLDISKLEALEELNCSSNQLSRLDISENVALKNLDCSSNQLSRVDIGNNDNLQVLNCSNNQFQGNFIADRLKGLKKLNVSNNKFTNIVFFDQNNIEELDCSNNAIPYLKNFTNLKTFKGDNQQVDVVVDRNDRRIRYKNFVLIELPQGNSKVKELSGGKLIDGSYFGEFIKVDESLPSKVTYKYEVSPGMFLDVTMNITYTELDPTNVVSMKIKNQPTKLTYTDGEKLDLSGLVVTLEDNNGLTKDVAFADFAANGITANPTDGTALTLADNAKNVSLTKGN
ncbi:MAG: bacterial Ig-like domain-containing protein, partial [Peptoniphilus grossensis]